MNLPAFLQPFIQSHEFLSFFLFLLLFGFTLPISEEIALALVGVAARSAGTPFLEVCGTAVLALYAADLGYYGLARVFGPKILRSRIMSRIVKPSRVIDGETYFEKRGPRILFICRFVVGLRAPAILASGLLRMRVHRFFLYDLSALLLSTPVWIFVGFALGAQFDAEVGLFGKIFAFASPAAIIVAAFLVYRNIKADTRKVLAESKTRHDALEKAAGLMPETANPAEGQE